jgi:hypothetical protein
VSTLNNYGLFLEDRGRATADATLFLRATKLLRRSLELRRRLFGEGHSMVATAFDSLGGLLHDRELYEEAVLLLDECWRPGGQLLGLDHPNTLASQLNLGAALVRGGSARDAQSGLRDLLDRMGNHAGIERSTLLIAKYYAAQCEWELGEATLAHRLIAESRRLGVELHGENSPQVARVDSVITKFAEK